VQGIRGDDRVEAQRAVIVAEKRHAAKGDVQR
jgi:hypothetical protein